MTDGGRLIPESVEREWRAKGLIPPPTRLLDGYDYLALDPDYDGSCPCADFEVDGTKFLAHCWRICGRCVHAGLHYEGDRNVARRVHRAFVRMGLSEWNLRVGLWL